MPIKSPVSIRRLFRATYIALCVLTACDEHARATIPPEEADKAGRAVSQLIHHPVMSPGDTARLCEAGESRLTSAHRERCAVAHIAVAQDLLRAHDYSRARDSLAFAEMEGGPLDKIRKVREG